MSAMLFLLVLLISAAGIDSQDDPCTIYQEIDNYRRSTGYVTEYPEVPLCDDGLQPGWYRFNSKAGGQIPEGLVERQKCGTIAPIWIDGHHPNVSADPVGIKACANFQTGSGGGNGCSWSVVIGVKYCDDAGHGNPYYVYYLHPTPACPMAYCAGTKIPCPAGFWSENDNFESTMYKCKPAFPRMTIQPDLSGPEISGRAFGFTCTATVPPDHAGEKGLEFAWTLDGQDALIQMVRVYDPDTLTRLDGRSLKGLLGKSLGCKVRSFFKNNSNVTSPWLESRKSYWVGIKPDSLALTISEADLHKTVKLISTLPVLCEKEDGNDCCIEIKLRVSAADKGVYTQNKCSWSICSDAWRSITNTASVDISLLASQDIKTRPNSVDLLLAFDSPVAHETDSEDYRTVFNDHKIRSVQVDVRDADSKKCTLVSDPHITPVDQTSYFNLYDIGDFTIFKVEERNFEVQIRTWPCWGGRVTCICGVAAREHDDVIRIDGCDKMLYARNIGSPALKVMTRLREGTSIMQATDGSQIAVYFPSGSELLVQGRNDPNQIDHKYMDLTLQIPSIDKNKKAGGLCGTFDDNPYNDLTHRDMRTVYPACNGCTPQSFTNSWINDKNASLFEHVPQPAYTAFYLTRNCLCDDSNQTVVCTYEPEKVLPCPLCIAPPDYIRGGWNNTVAQTRRRRTADITYTFDVDETSTYDPWAFQDFKPVIPHWPTELQNITEQMADAKCRDGLRNSSLWTLCKASVEEVNSYIATCKEDIKIGDSYQPVVSMVSSFTVDCQVKLAKDPDNYVSTPDGRSIVKQEISTDVCSVLCDQHGYCDKGVCHCDQGYTGENCQLLKDQPPTLHRIRGSSVCDINQRPCRRIFIDAENIQMKDTLACRVQEIGSDGVVSAQYSMEDAQFVAITRLACVLPQTVTSVQRFAITATVDGKLYSSPSVNLTVFDSICQNCTETGCVKLPDTCLINDMCFADGDQNPTDGSKMCIVAESTSDWIQVYPNASAYISAPDNNGDVMCAVQTTDTVPSARYKLSWYVEGQRLPNTVEEDLPAGHAEAKLRRTLLPLSGNLTCKIRSYYTDRNVMSPFIESSVIDLDNIARYPVITVNLTGPDSSNAMVCSAQTIDTSPSARYQVSWFVDGQPYPRNRELSIPAGRTSAVYNRADLPRTGILTCKLRSYYTGVDIYSPFVVSNEWDLAQI